MTIDALNFRLNGGTYSLPVTGNSNVGTYGTLIQRSGNRDQKVLLTTYKDLSKTVVYSDGMRRYYYSAGYPSIHCRKNNTNYSCCNNYQNYAITAWTFDYAYTGRTSKLVSYAENSYLGSSYNKYAYQTQLAPYGMVTPSRDGYTFKGWNTSADDTGNAYKSTSTMRCTSSDTTFYALWARIDAGSYRGQDFWNRLTDWFGGVPPDGSCSADKISNHRVTLTIDETVLQLYPGTKFCIFTEWHTDGYSFTRTVKFGYQPEPNILALHLIGWHNNWGQSEWLNCIVSDGWLTDGGPSS